MTGCTFTARDISLQELHQKGGGNAVALMQAVDDRAKDSSGGGGRFKRTGV